MENKKRPTMKVERVIKLCSVVWRYLRWYPDFITQPPGYGKAAPASAIYFTCFHAHI